MGTCAACSRSLCIALGTVVAVALIVQSDTKICRLTLVVAKAVGIERSMAMGMEGPCGD